MGEMTIMERIREWLGNQCFRLFLWFRGWTEDQYLHLVECGALDRSVALYEKAFEENWTVDGTIAAIRGMRDAAYAERQPVA